MGAPSSIVFFGIRFHLDAGEIEAIETRTDPRIQAARQNKLDYHLGLVVTPSGPHHCLYVGRRLAVTGPENPSEVAISHATVVAELTDTAAKLAAAGWKQSAELTVSFEPD